MANARPFIIALAFGLIAVVLVYFYIQKVQKEASTEELEMAIVVRATEGIPPGRTITEDMVEEIEVLASQITPDTMTEMDEVLNQVSLQMIHQNEVLLKPMFEAEERLEILSRRLESGERAVTVGVSEVSGLGGNLKIGDLVDVMVTILNNDEVGVASTFTVLRGVEVMAIGQDIAFDETELESGSGQVSKSVTLKVEPEEGELLTLASEVGSIRLALLDPDETYLPLTEGTALTEFIKYTPTREDNIEEEQRLAQEREAEHQRQLQLMQAAAEAGRQQVQYQQNQDTGEVEIVEVPELGPPPIIIELILGGQSQLVELPADK